MFAKKHKRKLKFDLEVLKSINTYIFILLTLPLNFYYGVRYVINIRLNKLPIMFKNCGTYY